ncbi:MAG: alpha/beta fold hydrolase [Pseudomonadota bacterium]|nr:alpha/beta fold hydrolase [Pseudomonadota bacterium]
MFATPLRREIVEPTTPADACVIWLHGLGASGHDFVPVVPHLKLKAGLAVRFIFPHAPDIPVTCNGGYVMPAWYDILALTEIREINLDHLRQAQAAINQLIQEQLDLGIPAHRIVLIGFSQGGAVAYHTALQFHQRLAGLIALSTYLPNPDTLVAEARIPNQELPIHIAHGDHDDMVTERAARAAFTWLQEQGYSVDWSHYPMGHEVCITEIRHIGEWLNQWL